jgi:signal transduction histidine kinase
MTPENSPPDFELISDIVHDLKAPLIAVRGFLELVMHLGTLNESQANWMNRSFGALDRMEQLIINLLDYARLEAGGEIEPEPVDLREIVDTTISLMEEMAAERKISLVVEGTDDSLIVDADATLISQVINNLLANAIKYNRDDGQVVIKMMRQGPLAQVAVKDTGVGIQPGEHHRIFDRFYRAHIDRGDEAPIQRGSGLGLAIARTVIERHGGDIWVNSVPGKGSTFTFTLPINGPDAGRSQAPRNERHYAQAPGQTAIEPRDAVDDDTQEASDYIENESHKDTP